MSFIPIVMSIGLLVSVGLAVSGLIRWRSGGDRDVNLGMMAALAPGYFLLTGRIPENILVFALLAGMAVAFTWRILIIRRERNSPARFSS